MDKASLIQQIANSEGHCYQYLWMQVGNRVLYAHTPSQTHIYIYCFGKKATKSLICLPNCDYFHIHWIYQHLKLLIW